MRKLLLGLGLVVLLSSCSSSDEPAVEAEPDTIEQTLVESEVVIEPQEVVVESEPVVKPEPDVEPEPDVPENDSIVESKSAEMDFPTCMLQQAAFAEAILSSGNYKVIPIVDTELRSMVKFCTNDDSVIHTCSALDNTMVVAKSTDRVGC